MEQVSDLHETMIKCRADFLKTLNLCIIIKKHFDLISDLIRTFGTKQRGGSRSGRSVGRIKKRSIIIKAWSRGNNSSETKRLRRIILYRIASMQEEVLVTSSWWCQLYIFHSYSSSACKCNSVLFCFTGLLAGWLIGILVKSISERRWVYLRKRTTHMRVFIELCVRKRERESMMWF